VIHRVKDGISQIVVPKHMITEILTAYHSSTLSGHLYYDKTWPRIKTKFYWPEMNQHTKKFCESCVICQEVKKSTHKSRAKLVTIGFQELFRMIGIDITGPLPTTARGNKYIIVAIDYCSKWCEVLAIKDFTALTTVKFLIDNWICRFGVPEKILTDQGTNFEANLFQQLCQALKIEKLRSNAYHPECNGEVERQNRTLKSMLACYVNNNHNDWDLFLPSVTFAYNTAVHSTTGKSPFEVVFGRSEVSLNDIKFAVNSDKKIYTNQADYLKKLEMNRISNINQIKVQNDKRKLMQKQNYDKKVYDERKFNVNDLVLVHNTQSKVGQTPKFIRNWLGPYRILKIINEIDFVLQNVANHKQVQVHYNRLKKFNQFEITSEPTVVEPAKKLPKVAVNSECINYNNLNFLLFESPINLDEESQNTSVYMDAGEDRSPNFVLLEGGDEEVEEETDAVTIGAGQLNEAISLNEDTSLSEAIPNRPNRRTNPPSRLNIDSHNKKTYN
jgi:hypothetical protein